MGKLTDNLKRVLEGLAYQDAADYLSTEQKLEVLGIEPPRKPASPVGAVSRRFGLSGMGRRIALISAGSIEAPALDFALGACRRHAAVLDLVRLGGTPAREDEVRKLSRTARQTGTQVSQVNLPHAGAEALRDYVCSHPSLIYLVATVADDLARELTERILQTAGVQVPLVLVGGHTPPKSFSVYAA